MANTLFGTPDFESYLQQTEQKYGLPSGLLRAQVQQESGGDPAAQSPKGAQGILQLMPGTQQQLGVTNPFDWQQNLDAGARYLRHNIDTAGGNLQAGLAGYNWGPGHIPQVLAGQPMPSETQGYVQSILARMGGAPQGPAQGQTAAGGMQYLQLPSGKYYQYNPQQTSADEAQYMAAMLYPQEFEGPQPPHEQSLGDAFMSGVKGMGQSTMTGIQSLWDPNAAALQAIKNSENLQKQYGSSGDWSNVEQAYDKDGIVGGMKEFIADYITHPIAENAPQIAAIAAGTRLGAMAGSAIPGLGTAVGAGIGGVVGAAAAFAPSLLSSNIERQAQKQLKDNPDGPVDIAMGPALAATAGQSVLNIGALRFAGGALMKPFLKQAEVEGLPAAEAALAKEAMETQKRLYAKGYTGKYGPEEAPAPGELLKVNPIQKTALGAGLKGAAQGATIMPMDMVMQTVLSRAQAGQDLLSQDALDEYGKTAYGAAGVGAALGGLGHFGDPASARAQLAKIEAAQQAAHPFAQAEDDRRNAWWANKEGEGQFPAPPSGSLVDEGTAGIGSVWRNDAPPPVQDVPWGPKALKNVEQPEIPPMSDAERERLLVLGGTQVNPDDEQRYQNWLKARAVFQTDVSTKGKDKGTPYAVKPVNPFVFGAAPTSPNAQPKVAPPAQYDLYWRIPELRKYLPPDELQRRLANEAQQKAMAAAEALQASTPLGVAPPVAMNPGHQRWLDALQQDEKQRDDELNEYVSQRLQASQDAAQQAEQQAQQLDMAGRSADALQARLASPIFQLGIAAGDPLLVAKLHAALGSGVLGHEIDNFYGTNRANQTTVFDTQGAKRGASFPGAQPEIAPEHALEALNARIASQQNYTETLRVKASAPSAEEADKQNYARAQAELANLTELRKTLNSGISLQNKLAQGKIDTVVAKALGGSLPNMSAAELSSLTPDTLTQVLTARQQALENERMSLLHPDVQLTDDETGLLTPEGEAAARNEVRLNYIKSTLAMLAQSKQVDPSEGLATFLAHTIASQRLPKEDNGPTSAVVEPSTIPEREMMLYPTPTGPGGPSKSMVLAVRPDERPWRIQQAKRLAKQADDLVQGAWETGNALHRGEYLEAAQSRAAKAKDSERELLKLGWGKRSTTALGEKLGAALEKSAPEVYGPKKTTSEEMARENERRTVQYGNQLKAGLEAKLQNQLENLRKLFIDEAAERHAIDGGRLPRDQALGAVLRHMPRLKELMSRAAEGNYPEIQSVVAQIRQELQPGSPELAKPVVRRAPPEVRLGDSFWQPEKTRQQQRDMTWDRVNETLTKPLPPEVRDVLNDVARELAPEWRKAEVGEATPTTPTRLEGAEQDTFGHGLALPTAGSDQLLALTNELLDRPSPEVVSELREALRQEQDARASQVDQGQLFGEAQLPSPFLARANAHQFQRFLKSKAVQELRAALLPIQKLQKAREDLAALTAARSGSLREEADAEAPAIDELTTQANRIEKFIKTVGRHLDRGFGPAEWSDPADAAGQDEAVFVNQIASMAKSLKAMDRRMQEMRNRIVTKTKRISDRAQTIAQLHQEGSREARDEFRANPDLLNTQRRLQGTDAQRQALEQRFTQLQAQIRRASEALERIRPEAELAADRAKLAAEQRRAQTGTTSVVGQRRQVGTEWPRDEQGRMREIDWQNESGTPINRFRAKRPGERTVRENPFDWKSEPSTAERMPPDTGVNPFRGTELDTPIAAPEPLPPGSRIPAKDVLRKKEAAIARLRKQVEKADIPAKKAELAEKLKALEEEHRDLMGTFKEPRKDEVRAGGTHGLPVDELRARGDKNLPRKPAVGAVGAEMGDEPGKVRRSAKGKSEPAEVPEFKGRVPSIGEIETPPQLINSNLNKPVLGGEGTNADAVRASMQAQAAAKAKRTKPKKGGLARQGDTPPMTPVSFDDARMAVQRMQGELGDTATIYHGRDGTDIPGHLKNEMLEEGTDPSSVNGWISNDGKRIWINNAMHADMSDIERTLAHEIIGHRKAIPIIEKAWENNGGFHGFARALDGAGGGGVNRLLEDLGIREKYQEADLDTKAKEAIAAMEERRPSEGMTDTIRRAWKELVGAVRDWMRKVGLMNFANAKDYDIYHMLRQARNADHLRDVNLGDKGLASAVIGPRGNTDLQTHMFGDTPTARERLKEVLGFGKKSVLTRMQYIDQHEGILRALDPSVRGAVARSLSAEVGALEAVRALEYATHAQMFINQAMVSGIPRFVNKVLKWASHGGQSHGMDTVEAGGTGPSIKWVMEPIVQGQRDTKALSEYLAYERATSLHDGWRVLFGGDKGNEFYAANKDKIQQALAEGRADPVFQEMRRRYKKYNEGLLKFAQDTRWLSPEFIRTLDPENYAGYYRTDSEDNVYANFGDKKIFVGNLREQPDLKPLLGDDKPILDISASMIKNTNLIIRNSLRNLGTMKTANALLDLGAGTVSNEPVLPRRGANFIHYNDWDNETGQPLQRSFQVDTDKEGSKLVGSNIPTAAIVSGLEGTVSVTGPLMDALAAPAGFFRKATIRNPLYVFRTAIREPLALWGTSGADFVPILGTIRDIVRTIGGSNKTFDRTAQLGLNSTFVFSGDPKDLTREIAGLHNEKGPLGKLMMMADHAAIAAEASVRDQMFDSYLRQGLNEEEAAHAVVKNGIDFFQRGKSPAISVLRRLVPFAGAQITSLDVLQKAARGQLPYSERLQIQQKMLTRGLMLASATMAYALLMKDNKAYQNAPDDEKYGNFFLPINDQFAIKAPIPWEYGYIFKVLPEALMNHFTGDTSNTELAQQLISMLGNVSPGVIPTTIKPFLEASTNHDFFTGRPIISDEQAKLTQGERYTPNTTEIAKKLSGEWFNVGGQSYGISPIMLEHFVKSYVAPMGFAAVQFASMPFENRAARKLSEMPIVGSTFQDSDGARYLNLMEDLAAKTTQQKDVYNNMIKQQRFDDAASFMNDPDKVQQFAFATPAEKWQQADQKIRNAQNQYRFMPGMSADEKLEAIRELERQRIELARAYRPVFPAQ